MVSIEIRKMVAISDGILILRIEVSGLKNIQILQPENDTRNVKKTCKRDINISSDLLQQFFK